MCTETNVTSKCSMKIIEGLWSASLRSHHQPGQPLEPGIFMLRKNKALSCRNHMTVYSLYSNFDPNYIQKGFGTLIAELDIKLWAQWILTWELHPPSLVTVCHKIINSIFFKPWILKGHQNPSSLFTMYKKSRENGGVLSQIPPWKPLRTMQMCLNP